MDGLPEGVTLEPVDANEAAGLANQLFSSDELQSKGITLEAVDAPANIVFDQDKGRTLALPQTLNATETEFVIKRDIDGAKNFFGMQETGKRPFGGFMADAGRGALNFFASTPQIFGSLVKEQAELAKDRMAGKTDFLDESILGGMFKLYRNSRDAIMKEIGTEDVIAKSQGLIDRNKKWVSGLGVDRPAEGGNAGVFYDVGQAGASLLSAFGMAAFTRNPDVAALWFGAMQKSKVFEEARAAGADPAKASDISSVAGIVEGGLEFIGLDYFMKAVKGNSAMRHFVAGFTEFSQEGSQAIGEEAVTQGTGIRQKSVSDTIEDILYQAAIGAIVGGAVSVAAGVKSEAKNRGLDEATADKLASYAEKNVAKAKTNLGEFIDKELAPIAKDDASAQQFITLMQKFGNDQALVEPEQLEPEDRAVFGQYIQMFNASKTDKGGVAEVEKAFYDHAIEAGMNEEEAQAASKLIGARADAASRALGVSPQEWLDGLRLQVSVEGKATPSKLISETSVTSSSQEPSGMSLSADQPAATFFKRAVSPEGNNTGVNASISKVYHKTSDIEQIKKAAKEMEPQLVDFLGLVTGGVEGAEVYGVRVKETDSLKVKSVSKKPEQIGDFVGGRILVDSEAALKEVVARIEKIGDVMEVDDFTDGRKPSGYRAVHIQIMGKDGVSAEIQIQPREINEAQGYAHKAYKHWQKIEAAHKEAGTSLSDEEMVDQRADVINSKKLFDDAWAEFTAKAARAEKEKAQLEEAAFIKKSFSEKERLNSMDTNNPASVQKNLGLSYKPVTLLQFIKQAGGIHIGLTNEEVNNVKAARKQKRMSAAKSKMASGELQRIFEGKGSQLGALISDKGMGLDELYGALTDAGYIEGKTDAYQNQDASDADVVLALIEKEVNGSKVYTLDVELEIERLAESYVSNTEYLQMIGLDQSMSEQEIANILSDYRMENEALTRSAQGNFGEVDVQFQGDEKKPQGSITFGKEGILIKLFKSANPSTILHELGHLFLRDMQAVSKVSKRPMVRKDYDAVKKFLGAKGDTFTVAQEEKFARAFEAYLREGKAPKPELQGVFDKFKRWLTDIYKSVVNLNVQLSPEIRQVFDRMLGSDYAQAETLNQSRAARNIEDDYAAVAATADASTFLDDTGNLFRDMGNWGSDALTPISTRLGKIHQGIKHSVRRFLFDTGLHTHEDKMKVKPFLTKVSDTFSEADYKIFDLALKNRDHVKADFLIDKYGIQQEWAAVREVLDSLYLAAQDVGLDLQYLEEYFPRKVRRNMAGLYMAAMRRQSNWSEIELAMKEADPNGLFTREDQADFVNNFLRGFVSSRINLSKPSFTKERTVDYVTPEFNAFYQDSMPTLIEYIGAMRHGIEVRKLFGKSETETENNIGEYVSKLVEQGLVEHKEEEELKALLKGVVDARGTRGWINWAKNATYIYTMGSPISAITQIKDLAFSLYKNGFYRTGVSLAKSVTGNQILSKEDLGIDNVLQEYEDETRAAEMVRKVFKLVGISTLDNIGKETYIGASYERLKARAAANDAQFKDFLNLVFEDKADQVKADLLAGNMTEDVKYILFSELSDIQPISISEMPLYYANGGNWRLMYMLKSYTVRQLDIFRREAIDDIFTKDPARVAKGFKNLLHLAICLLLVGVPTDALKDFLLGRDIDLNDLAINNILNVMGFSKYTIFKTKTEGIQGAVISTVVPPILSAPTDLVKDVNAIVVGKVDGRNGKTTRKPVKDAETLGHVPVIGKFYYWWFGGGAAKTAKKEKKGKGSKKVSTP